MTNLALVDPELLDGLAFFPPLALSKACLPDVRQRMLAIPVIEANPAVLCEEFRIDGLAGAPPVRVLLYRPREAAATARAAILDIHGGGYIMGSPEIGRRIHESL